MALREIPVAPSTTAQTMEISLDGVLYNFRFAYNIRQASWSVDILESDDTVLIQGIKLSVDWLPLFRYQIPNFPPGTFSVVDTSGAGEPPGKDDFGLDRRVKFYYDESLV